MTNMALDADQPCCVVRVNPTSAHNGTAEAASRSLFFGTSSLLLAAAAAATIVEVRSMPTLCAIDMPGGWRMSTAWLRLSTLPWFDGIASFLRMWTPMTAAMMLPSLIPMLWSYRQEVGPTTHARGALLVSLVGAGYFSTWSICGLIVLPVCVALIRLEMQWPLLARAAPVASALIILLAGVLQFTAWKARQLACCRRRRVHGQRPPDDARCAWRHGLRLGLHCSCCCAGLTAVLLVAGMMNLWAMLVVTAAITAERLAPLDKRVAQLVGAAIIVVVIVTILAPEESTRMARIL